MKTFLLILLATILLLLCSCLKEEDSITGNLPEDYAPGEVAFGLNDSISFIQLADFIYVFNNISIKKVTFFQYYTSVSKDSMPIIKATLEAKSYIRDDAVTIFYIDSIHTVMTEFWVIDFKSEDRSDWKETKELFSLVHLPQKFQLGLLKVEQGTEKEWIKLLSNTKLFRFTELNYIDRTQ